MIVLGVPVVAIGLSSGGRHHRATVGPAVAGAAPSTTAPRSGGGHHLAPAGGSSSTDAPSTTVGPTTTTTLPVSAAGTGGLAAALRPGQTLPVVAALSALHPADAIVELPTTITAAEVQALTHLQGVSAVEEMDLGTVKVQGASVVVAGVDPGTFRQFTPQVTATRDQLWSYVQAGALVADYDAAAANHLSAGQALTVQPATGTQPAPVGWLGATASLGLPGVDLVVSSAYGGVLGLVSDNGLIVSAPGTNASDLEASLDNALHGADIELINQPGSAPISG